MKTVFFLSQRDSGEGGLRALKQHSVPLLYIMLLLLVGGERKSGCGFAQVMAVKKTDP